MVACRVVPVPAKKSKIETEFLLLKKVEVLIKYLINDEGLG
jgi:hypothetical protein